MTRPAVRDQVLDGLECMVTGAGPPLVLLPGLAPENGRPTGVMRSAEISIMTNYAQRFTVYWIGRPTGLEHGVTFAELGSRLAAALTEEFAGAVNVLGISTGGSLAQQLAADHPTTVRRLVLMSTGSRLAGEAKALQRKMIVLADRGEPRPLMAALARELVPSWHGRTVAAGAMYSLGPRLYPHANDLTDLLETLRAEDEFDLRRLPTITAPTLIINGGRDRFYQPDIVLETAGLIPRSRLSVQPGLGHVAVVGNKRAVAEAIGFLAPAETAVR